MGTLVKPKRHKFDFLGTMATMSTNRKHYGPLDEAAMRIIDELRGEMSVRAVSRASKISHNRTATIFRRDTPPPTMTELEALARVFGKSASWVVQEAERREVFGTVTDLWPHMVESFDVGERSLG